MCGRFSLAADPEELQLAFPGFDIPEGYTARYNIAPSQPVMAVTNSTEKKFELFTWGLIPSWAKDPAISVKMINARSEGITEKPSFKSPFKYRRCLVPASGFFEWKAQPGQRKKIPYYFHASDQKLFGLAGLWDEWHSPDGSMIRSLTLITTSANETIKPYHDRMPVILARENYDEWLFTDSKDSGSLTKLLQPLSAFNLEAYQVGDFVNTPKNDFSECLIPFVTH